MQPIPTAIRPANPAICFTLSIVGSYALITSRRAKKRSSLAPLHLPLLSRCSTASLTDFGTLPVHRMWAPSASSSMTICQLPSLERIMLSENDILRPFDKVFRVAQSFADGGRGVHLEAEFFGLRDCLEVAITRERAHNGLADYVGKGSGDSAILAAPGFGGGDFVSLRRPFLINIHFLVLSFSFFLIHYLQFFLFSFYRILIHVL